MKLIPDKSIDMILCDLPYGTTACKWDVIIPFEPLWEQYKRIIKDKGCIALFGSEPFSSYLRMSNIKGFKYDWVWEKERPSNITGMHYSPGRVHEIISIFNSKIYYPIMENSIQPKNNKKGLNLSQSGIMNRPESIPINTVIQDEYDNTKRFPRDVIRFNREIRNNSGRYHPNQKPIKLLEYLIKTYTLENETILDNCMGSGSVGIACKYTNRKFIGIEKDEKYFEIAVNRIKHPEQNPNPISKYGNLLEE
jgi:site-specific DNA-methyltransferase (adenine-specific)